MIGENQISGIRPAPAHMSSADLSSGGEYWTIGDMARRYDISLRALRFYEDRGLINPLRQGTARLYDSQCRERLEKVLKAKRLGFTLGRIHDMLKRSGEAETAIERTLAPAEVVAQIAVLERQKMELDAAISSLRAVQSQIAQGADRADENEVRTPLARAV